MTPFLPTTPSHRQKRYLKTVQEMASQLLNVYDCSDAAFSGDLQLLQELRAKGAQWDENVCYQAAFLNNLEMLKWARENGAPWNGGVCAIAIVKDHHELLEWAIENGCPSAGPPVASQQ